MTLEIDIENAFVAYAATRGCRAEKLVLKGARSWPDRTVFCPGSRVICFEFKKPGGRKRAAQIKRVEDLRRLGIEAFFVDNVDTAITIFEDFLGRNR